MVMTMKGSNMNLAFGLEVIYEDAEVPCSAAGAGIRQRKY